MTIRTEIMKKVLRIQNIVKPFRQNGILSVVYVSCWILSIF